MNNGKQTGFAVRLLQALNEAGLSQVSLDKAGIVSKAMIQFYLNRGAYPTIDTAEKIAFHVKKSASWLAFGEVAAVGIVAEFGRLTNDVQEKLMATAAAWGFKPVEPIPTARPAPATPSAAPAPQSAPALPRAVRKPEPRKSPRIASFEAERAALPRVPPFQVELLLAAGSGRVPDLDRAVTADHHRHVAGRIVGESMSPLLLPGDVVRLRILPKGTGLPAVPPGAPQTPLHQLREHVPDGAICLLAIGAMLDNGEYTVKRVVYGKGKIGWTLDAVAVNPDCGWGIMGTRRVKPSEPVHLVAVVDGLVEK